MEKPDYTIEYHRSHPNVSLDDHVRNRIISLGKFIHNKELIYLDKRFWIILRNVELGQDKRPASLKLLSALRSRVSCAKSVCPISESVFIELYKQEDMTTRRKTAELIDELSTGITLAPYQERVGSEIAHLIYDLASSTFQENIYK